MKTNTRISQLNVQLETKTLDNGTIRSSRFPF